MTISGVIDLGLAPYVQRALRQAESDGAAALVLEINTFGGRVDAAVQIRDALIDSKVRTLAFVNKRAISAGALIALASHRIAMAGGSTIGAATPVQVGGAGGQALPTEEKTVSYVRKEFRATAESRGRPPAVAEAMVDSDVVIPGLVEKGKLLTLTTDEALAQKIADFRADTLADALAQSGLAGAEVRRLEPNWAEEVVRVLTHPVLSSLLVSVGMLGILLELRTPGFGVAGAIGLAALGLFLWGHWLVALAGWEEMLLVGGGVALLLLELLVIPGFGVAGVLGIAAILAGLVLSMVGPGNTMQLIAAVGVRVGLALALAVAASLVLMRFLTRLPVGRRLVLETQLRGPEGYASAPDADAPLLGKHGLARSMLRPAGIAEIEGRRVDVVTEGELVDAGDPVVVIRVDGNRVVVQRAATAHEAKG
ncbi:MAG TPA: NfeD family protein [Ramlibacter sp.]|nr:NfeD family protein [Ramlibacter sp.]